MLNRLLIETYKYCFKILYMPLTYNITLLFKLEFKGVIDI